MNEFEWNEDKNLKTIKDRGISFEDGMRIFLGEIITAPSNNRDYGEDRSIAVGETDGRILAVVYTMRGEICRIISVRKARKNEREAYNKAILERYRDRQD